MCVHKSHITMHEARCYWLCNMCALNFAASGSALAQNDIDFLNDLKSFLIVLK